jgi:cytoskeletal protein CcmA (bactofilin family)
MGDLMFNVAPNNAAAGSSSGVMVVTADTAIKGTIRRCRRLEVSGYVEGEIVADDLVVNPGGRVVGRVKSKTADISGILNGDVVVDGLMQLRGRGSVTGTVQYGRLAMEDTADLDAQVRNVPPRLAGDFEIQVQRGRSARVTPDDITAIDPDDVASALKFEVSDEVGGMVTLMGDRTRRAQTFTQADLIGGRVIFVHDGGHAPTATFSVTVRDASGGYSGEPKAVKVTVLAPGQTASFGAPPLNT